MILIIIEVFIGRNNMLISNIVFTRFLAGNRKKSVYKCVERGCLTENKINYDRN